MWQREFGNSVNVAGQRIRINSIKLPITDVAPDRLEGLYRDQAVDVWTPLPAESFQDQNQNSRDVWVLARIRDGVSMGEAQRDIRRQLGDSEGIYVAPYSGASPTMAKGLAQIGTMLEFASVAVFLVACCVVASLLLGRALRRIHIMSINVALGATRLNLMMELLSDCMVVSLVGGALGLLLAMGTARCTAQHAVCRGCGAPRVCAASRLNLAVVVGLCRRHHCLRICADPCHDERSPLERLAARERLAIDGGCALQGDAGGWANNNLLCIDDFYDRSVRALPYAHQDHGRARRRQSGSGNCSSPARVAG